MNDVRPGQEVIAIGLALGVFQNSVTRGIISAIRRADRTVMLQTDAAINPGNSGGPLLNRQGQVVGINTLKVGGAAESLGFAVAADHARALLGGGKATEPFATSAPAEPAAGAGVRRAVVHRPRARGRHEAIRSDRRGRRRARRCSSTPTGTASRRTAPCAWRPGTTASGSVCGTAARSSTRPTRRAASAVQELEEMASQVRSVMGTAQEDARRASVLPGQLRDIRRRYRMDWPGFER